MFNPIQFYLSGVANKPFISTWKTDNLSAGSSTSTQIKLPLSSTGTYNFLVEWGDGSSNIITNWGDATTTHTYSVAGTYTVKIKGVCTGWVFNNTGDRLKLLSITQWGPLILGTNQTNYFYGCANLTLTDVTDVLNLSGRISLGGLVDKTTLLTGTFRDCTSLTTVNRMDEWNTSEITLMATMFQGATLFNQYIGSWNTSSVLSMQNMLSDMSTFNQDISQKTVTVNGVTYTAWDVSKVTSFTSMFARSTSFNQPIINWIFKTSGVTFNSMFSGATNFNQPLNSWNTIGVTAMNNVFQLSGFNNGLLSGVAGTMTWDTSSVTNISNMFSQAASFNQNVGSWNFSNVTNFQQIFFQATKFNNGGDASIGNWVIKNTGDSISMRQMFQGAIIFNQPIGTWDTSFVTNMSAMFHSNTGFNQPIGTWNVVNAVDMNTMFFGATTFNQPLNSWNVQNVNNMSSMFQGATAFNQDIGSWNIRVVSNFTNFMVGKTALTFSTTNLDAIYNGWSTRTVIPGIAITFGTAKYTAAGSAGKAILQASPKLWIITDGGI